MSRAAAVAYLAFVALLIALLAALWWAPGALGQWRHWPVPPAQPPQLDDVRAALLHANPAAAAAYPAVLERPLFNPARRPVASASSAPAAAPPPPSAIEQARLQGIVAGPTLSGALVEEGGQPRFVRIGETVGDWTLARVQGRQAVFTRHGQERTLDWPADAPPPPAAGPKPPTAAAKAATVVQPVAAPRPPAAQPPAPPPAPASAGAAPAARGSFGGGSAKPTPAPSGAAR